MRLQVVVRAMSEDRPTERFVCTDASIDRGEPVTATASQVKAWLLIEVHGAWGPDAIEESRLGAHLPPNWRTDLQRGGIRPICIRPAVRGSEPAQVRVFFVIAARPGQTIGRIWTRTIELSEVHYLSQALQGALSEEEPTLEGWERHGERLVMVCTNGRHDQCCANRGRPVIRHLVTTRWAQQIWECSHIGGDRFAANILVAPESLYFGRMEPLEAETILGDLENDEITLEFYRGRSTLPYIEQAAEHALRQHLDERRVDGVQISAGPDRNSFRATVADHGDFQIQMARDTIITDEPLTCRGTPNQKVARFSAIEIRRVQPLGGPGSA